MREFVSLHGGNFIFQQDSPPGTKNYSVPARRKNSFLVAYPMAPKFARFGPPGLCSVVHGSPGDLQKTSNVRDSIEMKSFNVLEKLDPEKIRAVCRKFRLRLEQCVAKKGSYFD